MQRGCLFLCLVLVPGLECFSHFQGLIPNGDKVPNPCDHRGTWDGVGHENQRGGGRRNPFGRDFQENGKQWSRELCNLDSDGDGRTNGQELGDPECTWAVGKSPSQSNDLSHPGICEPMTSDLCQQKNDWLKCSKGNNCSAFEEPETREVTLRFPQSNIPAQVTTYSCQIFDLPSDGDFHLVGTRAILDSKLTHHILLFGCVETEEEPVPSTNRAEQCGMLAHPKCLNVIGAWTVGTDADCTHKNEGYRIGRRGFRKAALQIHWNNPAKLRGETDSSGLVLYFTPKLRENDASMLVVGQEFLEIPPRQPEIEFSSKCSSDCTAAMFPNRVYITRAVNHMHYMGIAQRISLVRNGTMITDLTNDDPFNYDSPVFHTFDPPVEVLPGDEILTTCKYSSRDKNRKVYFGHGTSDEMCFGFITYYPEQKMKIPYCTTWKTVEKCKRYLDHFKGIIDNCDWKGFLGANRNALQVLSTVQSACVNSTKENLCPETCTKIVEKNYMEEPCLKGDLGELMLYKMTYSGKVDRKILGYLSDCRKSDISGTSSFNSYDILPQIIIVSFYSLYEIIYRIS